MRLCQTLECNNPREDSHSAFVLEYKPGCTHAKKSTVGRALVDSNQYSRFYKGLEGPSEKVPKGLQDRVQDEPASGK
jgi:hypothetical protein